MLSPENALRGYYTVRDGARYGRRGDAVEDREREEARKSANFLDRAMMLVGLFLAKPNGERLLTEMPPTLLRILKATLTTLAESGEAVLLDSQQEISPERRRSSSAYPGRWSTAGWTWASFLIGGQRHWMWLISSPEALRRQDRLAAA